MWLHFSLCFHGKSKVCKVIFTQGLKGISWLVFYVYLLLGMGFFDLKKYHLKKTESLANLVHILQKKILIFAEQLLSWGRMTIVFVAFLMSNFFCLEKKGRNKFHACTLFKLSLFCLNKNQQALQKYLQRQNNHNGS